MTGEEFPSGVGVAVTRGEGPDGPLSTLLKDRGARVLDWGTIAFAPPEDPDPLLAALDRLAEFDWICFSSPRAVEAVVSRIKAPPPGVRTAVVGPSTAAALAAKGWPVDRHPEEGRGRGLVEAFRGAGDAGGARVFFPASAIAREEIPRGLAELGARVHQVTAYRPVALPLDRGACTAEVNEGKVQVVTFASPSAVAGLRKGLGETLFGRLARDFPAAAMGPTTGEALSEVGWRTVTLARAPTLEGLALAALDAVRS